VSKEFIQKIMDSIKHDDDNVMLSLPAATIRELCILALAELDTYEHVVQEVKINSGGCHEFTVLQDIQHHMEDVTSKLGIELQKWCAEKKTRSEEE